MQIASSRWWTSVPRHGGVLLVTGPLVRSMREPVLAAFRAMPEPRRVITVGDGAGVFADSYATVRLPAEMVPAAVGHVAGGPAEILKAPLDLSVA